MIHSLKYLSTILKLAFPKKNIFPWGHSQNDVLWFSAFPTYRAFANFFSIIYTYLPVLPFPTLLLHIFTTVYQD